LEKDFSVSPSDLLDFDGMKIKSQTKNENINLLVAENKESFLENDSK